MAGRAPALMKIVSAVSARVSPLSRRTVSVCGPLKLASPHEQIDAFGLL